MRWGSIEGPVSESMDPHMARTSPRVLLLNLFSFLYQTQASEDFDDHV